MPAHSVMHDSPVSQSEIPWMLGSPEGNRHGPPGFIIVDLEGATIYWKSTPQEFNTGWIRFGGTPPSAQGFSPPVNTFQEVRDLVNPSVFKGVMSWGYTDPADGVLRIWRWSATETLPDNDGNVLESSFTPIGRWVQAL